MDLNVRIEIFKHITDSEKLLFTKHLAVMVKAGLPIDQIFETLIEQASTNYFKGILKEINADISNGQSLTVAFSKFPKVFDTFFISLIRVGEESGTLTENLEFLSKQLAKTYNLKKKIQNSMLYPELVLGVTTIIGGGISIFILPKLTDLFSSFQVQLPLITRILLWFANVMKDYGVLIFIVVFLLIGIFLWLIQIPSIRFWWHKIILKIPVFGEILKYGQLSQFTRNLGILLASGVPINTGLITTSQTVTNDYFKYLVKKISDDVEEGGEVSEAIRESGTEVFPLLVPRMVSVGEKTGKLDEVLVYLSDFYEEEMDNISKNLSTILEPVMLIIIGLVVAFVALAIISPIYQLTGSIGNK